MTIEVQVTKEKLDNLGFIKIKTFCATKDTITKVTTPQNEILFHTHGDGYDQPDSHRC